MKPIQSITKEKAACIAAFKKYPKAEYAWCFHHAVIAERIYGQPPMKAVMDRIREIKVEKSVDERAIRYRNMRPVKATAKPHKFVPNNLTMLALRRRFNREWPGNTWNGNTIFGDEAYGEG